MTYKQECTLSNSELLLYTVVKTRCALCSLAKLHGSQQNNITKGTAPNRGVLAVRQRNGES